FEVDPRQDDGCDNKAQNRDFSLEENENQIPRRDLNDHGSLVQRSSALWRAVWQSVSPLRQSGENNVSVSTQTGCFCKGDLDLPRSTEIVSNPFKRDVAPRCGEVLNQV